MIKFGFAPAGNLKEQGRNWNIMNSKVDAKEFDPFRFQDPTLMDWQGVDDYWATYNTFGPIVFFQISLVSDGVTPITWINGASMNLPIAIARRSGTDTQQYGLSFPGTTQTGFIDNGFGSIHIFGTNLGTEMFAAYDEVTGVDELNISGWYFR